MSDSLTRTADYYASLRNIPGALFVSQLQQESGFDPNAVNGDAVGIAQFMPATANAIGLGSANRTNPTASIDAASVYDSQLLAQCNGDYSCMLQKYGTLPGSGSTLTQSQYALLQQSVNANITANPNGVQSWIGPANATNSELQKLGLNAPSDTNATNKTDSSCGSWITDFSCNVATYGADILGFAAGIGLLIVGVVMLRDLPITKNVGGSSFVGALKTIARKGSELAIVE